MRWDTQESLAQYDIFPSVPFPFLLYSFICLLIDWLMLTPCTVCRLWMWFKWIWLWNDLFSFRPYAWFCLRLPCFGSGLDWVGLGRTGSGWIRLSWRGGSKETPKVELEGLRDEGRRDVVEDVSGTKKQAGQKDKQEGEVRWFWSQSVCLSISCNVLVDFYFISLAAGSLIKYEKSNLILLLLLSLSVRTISRIRDIRDSLLINV